MRIESVIAAGLQQSYRETEYETHGDEPFTMEVGKVCPALLSPPRTNATASMAAPSSRRATHSAKTLATLQMPNDMPTWAEKRCLEHFETFASVQTTAERAKTDMSSVREFAERCLADELI